MKQKISHKVASITDIEDEFRSYFDAVRNTIGQCEGELEDKLGETVLDVLKDYFSRFGVDLSRIIKKEETTIGMYKIDGRTDALIGFAVIEFKRYNLLRSEREFEKAREQVTEQYLNPIPLAERRKHVAVIFDGVTYAKIDYDEREQVWEVHKETFSINSFRDFLNIINGSTKKLVSKRALVNDFNIDSDAAIRVTGALYKTLERLNLEDRARAKMLFDEWDITLRHIYGGVLNEDRIRRDFCEIAKTIIGHEIKVEYFLFALYTYYSLIVKLIASEICGSHLNVVKNSILGKILSSESISKELTQLEEGAMFRRLLRVDNYIEGGYFAWYLDAWNAEMEEEIRFLLRTLNEYDLRSFQLQIENSRDLLKVLYQEIIPNRIRHDLGEYYTPDWLIQLAINESGYKGETNERLLDPGCGSGGFLIEAINRKKNSHPYSSKEELLEIIVNSIVGFDVNPVAVLTARTNYLLAISDLLDVKRKRPLSIPVYMADSVITPTTEGYGERKKDVYNISTVEGIFSIPTKLIDENLFHRIIVTMESEIPKLTPFDDFYERLTKENSVYHEFKNDLSRFYGRVLKLQVANLNKIWGRLIFNSFAPLFVEKFHYVVGNPPWIKWEFLSQDYKNKLGELYLKIYKLFSHEGMKAGLGFAHDDISIVFTYVTMDKYLMDGGKQVFVLKQTLWKSVAGSEFRKFRIDRNDAKIPTKVEKVIDLLELKPFQRSGSETSVAVFRKGEETSYPVPYEIWKLKPGQHLGGGESLKEVYALTTQENLLAIPDPSKDDIKASWVIYSDVTNIVSLSKVGSRYRARHGVVNDLVNVFFVDMKGKEENGDLRISSQNLPRAKKVHHHETTIEPNLVYPVLKPRHVRKWRITGYYYMIIPQEKAGVNNEDILMSKYPRTYSYLKNYETDLLARSSRWFKGGDKPFYSIFGVGEYTFTPYRVVWCAMSFQPSFCVVSNISDKMVGTKTVIPDNTIGYIPANDLEEAHFICGILNSAPISDYLKSRSSKSKWGISINMVNSIPIPRFDPKNAIHERIKETSLLLHTRISKISDEESFELENELNELVISLFDLEAYEKKVPPEREIEAKGFAPVLIDIKQLDKSYGAEKNVSECPFVVIDVETTGFSFNNGDRIVEIWAGRYLNRKLVDKFHVLLNPSRPMSPKARLHHGIADSMVQGQRYFNEIAGRFLRFIGETTIIVHNYGFDVPFISGQLIESGLHVPRNLVIDTLILARRQFTFGDNSLVGLSENIRTRITPTHRAETDGLATSEIFHWMVDRFSEATGHLRLLDLLELQGSILKFPVVYPRELSDPWKSIVNMNKTIRMRYDTETGERILTAKIRTGIETDKFTYMSGELDKTKTIYLRSDRIKEYSIQDRLLTNERRSGL